MNRQECCHVAGDIDFDKHGNMWLVTGDDTPAGGINAGGYGPFNDQKTDEQQTVRVTNATGGTFTLTYNGQTTAPLAWNATAAQVDAALEALSNVGANSIQTSGGPVQTRKRQRVLPPLAAAVRPEPDQRRRRGPEGGTVATATSQQGGWYQRLTGDSRRSALNTNDLRGKLLRIKVKDNITRRRRQQGRPRHGHRRVHDPVRQPVPARRGRAAGQDPPGGLRDGLPQPVPRPGRRERRRLHQRLLAGRGRRRSAVRGPAGTGRFEIVRKPSNYGWPTCYKRDLAYYKWNFHEFAPNTTTPARRCNDPPQLHECDGPTQRNDSLWNLEGGPSGRARPRRRAAGHRPGHLVLLPRQQRDDAARHPVPRLLRADARADRARLDHRVPAAVPRALHGRRRPARHDEVQLRPGQPEPEEVPAVLRRLGDLRRVDAGHAARGQARRAEPHAQDQRLPRLRQPRQRRRRDVPVRVRQPDGHAVRRGRRVLPADLRQRVQRHQPGRRHVQVGVRQGQAAAEGRADHGQDRRRLAADGQLLERRLARRGPG